MEKQYKARLQRVMDAVRLKKPDRVPIARVVEAFPMYFANITIEEAMYDYEKVSKAYDHFYAHFKPDLGWDPVTMYPAKVMDILGLKWFRWPGRAIEDPNQMYQFVEDEYMKGDEYTELLYDPTQFMLTKWIPRSFDKLQGLKGLNLKNSMWLNFLGTFAPFGTREVQESLKALMDAGEEIIRWNNSLVKYNEKMKHEYGIPVAYGTFGYAPFDMLGDTLRGTVPILEDLYDRPEEILEVCDKFLPIAIESAIAACKDPDRPFVWIWLHKGVDQFMSDELFKRFYWPTLQKYLIALTEANLIPVVYVEGSYNSRLEYLRDVPRGKLIYHFETIDMAKAKKVLGDVACIAGNLPNAMLSYGTVKEVEDYCKWLIDTCAPGGGFIMDTGALVEDAKPENFEAMFRINEDYGVYR